MTRLNSFTFDDHNGPDISCTKHDRNTPRIVCDDIIAGAIALLSDNEVALMTRQDLLDIIKAARDVPRFTMYAGHLTVLDDEYLRRVVYTIRCCMRSRCNEQSLERGLAPYFQLRILKQRSIDL